MYTWRKQTIGVFQCSLNHKRQNNYQCNQLSSCIISIAACHLQHFTYFLCPDRCPMQPWETKFLSLQPDIALKSFFNKITTQEVCLIFLLNMNDQLNNRKKQKQKQKKNRWDTHPDCQKSPLQNSFWTNRPLPEQKQLSRTLVIAAQETWHKGCQGGEYCIVSQSLWHLKLCKE